MKFTSLLFSALAIIILSMIGMIIIFYITAGDGCACIEAPPFFSVNNTINSTGTYINLTLVSASSFEEIKNLELITVNGDNRTVRYENSTIVQGTSVLFKVEEPDGTHVIGSVMADGNRYIIAEYDLL